MNDQEFLKYAKSVMGKRVPLIDVDERKTGIVCGYNTSNKKLILRVDGRGWMSLNKYDHVVTKAKREERYIYSMDEVLAKYPAIRNNFWKKIWS